MSGTATVLLTLTVILLAVIFGLLGGLCVAVSILWNNQFSGRHNYRTLHTLEDAQAVLVDQAFQIDLLYTLAANLTYQIEGLRESNEKSRTHVAQATRPKDDPPLS